MPATPEQLRPLRVAVAQWASQSGLDEPTLADLQLALGEAVANGVEHAYRGGPPGTVEVMLELTPGEPAVVAARVADQGSWRRPPTDPGFRGRGLTMIRALARNVFVLRDAAGTVVTFELPLPE